MKGMNPYARMQTYEAVQVTRELLNELIAAGKDRECASALVREFWDEFNGYVDQGQLFVYDESGEHSDIAEEGGWLVRERHTWDDTCNYFYISDADFQEQFNSAE